MKWQQNYKFKYTLAGAIFGLGFPIVALFIDFYRLGLPFSWDNIMLIQTNNPILYIIYTAPLFLGMFAYVGGDRQDKIEEINGSLEDEIEGQLVSLKESTQKLEKSLRFKESFLANMSHEIRTPMNGILGMIHIVREEEDLSPTVKSYVDTIYESSLGLLTILNDVLDLSKLEVGKMELKPVVVNIHDLIKQVLQIFLAIARQKDIEISYVVNDEIPAWYRVDKNRLSQVLSNLIGNAIKFTSTGSIRVELEMQHKTNMEVVFLINVHDTGVGLNKKEQELVFNEFLQLEYHNSMGTGLGLSICKRLTELLGGKIGVKSEKGVGSTFWFTFKTTTAQAPPVVQKSKFVQGSKEFNLRVLLVEDNKINQRVACLTLQKLGCIIDVAENGLEALEMYQPKQYDVIFMDVQMPEMDGITATKALKKQYTDLPPIIGLSANAMQGDAAHYISEGMDDYMSKPLLIDDLYQIFNRWFES